MLQTQALCVEELDDAFRMAVFRCKITQEIVGTLQTFSQQNRRMIEENACLKQYFDEVYGKIIAYLSHDGFDDEPSAVCLDFAEVM